MSADSSLDTPIPDATTHIIDGRALADAAMQSLRARILRLNAEGRNVRLDAILVAGTAGSEIYARNQSKRCEDLGIEYVLHELPDRSTTAEVLECVAALNASQDTRAIMAHLPLPDHVDTERVQAAIAPDKDVEGVNPANIGNIVYGRRSLVPCTALAVIQIIESTGMPLHGAVCVCVGASNIVGKPVAVLLMREEATVVSTNIHTRDLPALCRQADVLIAAAGVPGLVTADWVKPGALVIDVGVNRVKDADGKSKTVGDVAFDEVVEIAGGVTPVPGGVGPMTVAMMMRNTVDAAEA